MIGVKNMGFKVGIYALLIPILLFYCLLLCGCLTTSPGIPNLHLLQLEIAPDTHLRLGYFGICALGKNETICMSSAFSSRENILRKLNDSLPEVNLSNTGLSAKQVQVDLFINVLVLGALFIFLVFILEGFHVFSMKRERKVPATSATLRRQNFYRQSTLAVAWASAACVFAASIANTQTIRGMGRSSNLKISPGIASLGLHWATFILCLIFCTGLTLFRRGRSGQNASDTTEFPLD